MLLKSSIYDFHTLQEVRLGCQHLIEYGVHADKLKLFELNRSASNQISDAIIV